MIDVIYVPNHIKNNQFVGDHLHLNASFLLIADEADEHTKQMKIRVLNGLT